MLLVICADRGKMTIDSVSFLLPVHNWLAANFIGT